MKFTVGILVFAASASAWSHGGRTNSEGCHSDRKNGGYHCHGGGKSSSTLKSRVPPTSPNEFAPSRSAGGTYFANCSEARAAGAAPIRRGDAGYSSKLDRDGDGVACE